MKSSRSMRDAAKGVLLVQGQSKRARGQACEGISLSCTRRSNANIPSTTFVMLLLLYKSGVRNRSPGKHGINPSIY